MGGINFAWLAVWVLSTESPCRKLGVRDILSSPWVKPPRQGGGVQAVPRLCIVYPGICLTTEDNHGKLLSGKPKGAPLISTKHDLFSRLCLRSRCPQLSCCPVPSMAYALGDGINPRSA